MKALVREVQSPYTTRLEMFAIKVAIGAILIFAAALSTGCTPTQRKATLAVTSTTVLGIDWYQSQGYVKMHQEDNAFLSAGFPCSVYFPLVMAANLALGYGLGEIPMALMTGVEGHVVVRNALTP